MGLRVRARIFPKVSGRLKIPPSAFPKRTCSDRRLGEEDEGEGRARVGKAHDSVLAFGIEDTHVVTERIAKALAARAPPQLLETPVATALCVNESAPPARSTIRSFQ